MKRNDKKKYLRDYIYIDSDIMALQDEYEILYTQATKMTPVQNEIGGGHATKMDSAVERNAVKLVEIQRKIEKLKDKKKRIEAEVAKLKPHQRYLITRVDLEHVPISRVARETHRAEATVRNNRNNIIDTMFLQ